MLSFTCDVFTKPVIIELQRGTFLCLNSALLYATLKFSMHSLNSASIINVYTNITSIKSILIIWSSPLQVHKLTPNYATACNFYSKWRREVAPLPLCKRVIDACTCNGNGNSGNIALWKRKKVFEQPPKWQRDGHKSRRVAMVEMLRLFSRHSQFSYAYYATALCLPAFSPPRAGCSNFAIQIN